MSRAISDAVRGERLAEIRPGDFTPLALTFSADGGTLLARAARHGPARRWDAATGNELPREPTVTQVADGTGVTATDAATGPDAAPRPATSPAGP